MPSEPTTGNSRRRHGALPTGLSRIPDRETDSGRRHTALIGWRLRLAENVFGGHRSLSAQILVFIEENKSKLKLKQGLCVWRAKGPHSALLNIHGGYWRAKYDLAHAGHPCQALRAAGIATVNIEYRRVGNDGGGWPGTFADIRSAYRFVQQEHSRFFPR